MQQDNYELFVCVDGHSIREYGHKGLTYVEGRKGRAYTIKFRNNTAARVLAVVSVDCIDVVDGKPATNESRGYIVPGYQSIEIKGWRTSKEKVNSFTFDHKPRSNSTQIQKGDDTNCGVIAVKVFGEMFDLKDLKDLKDLVNTTKIVHEYHHHYTPPPLYQPPPLWPWWDRPWVTWMSTTASPVYGIGASPSVGAYTCASNLGGEVKAMGVNFMTNCDNSASSPPTTAYQNAATPAAEPQETPSFNLGTGWGAEINDQIEEVKFKRGVESAWLSVYYSDEQGLKDVGIEVNKKPAVLKPSLPKSFHGFCTPPALTSD